jgi:hypothetical protein
MTAILFANYLLLAQNNSARKAGAAFSVFLNPW